MAIAKLVTAPTIDDRIKTDCREILMEALEKVDAGEITGCVLILQHSDDGHWSDKRSGVRDFAGVIGKLTIIMHAWMKQYLEEAKCP